MNIIEFKNVSKSYSDKLIIKDLSLQIAEGEFITIVGTSGNGKTTLLKMINSLEKKTSGKINILGLCPCTIPGLWRPSS